MPFSSAVLAVGTSALKVPRLCALATARERKRGAIQQPGEAAASKRGERQPSPKALPRRSHSPRTGSRRDKHVPPAPLCGLQRQFLGEFFDH